MTKGTSMEESMYILGITSGSDSGVALFKDNMPILAVNEERLSRIKLDDTYPSLSISWCLRESGLEPADIDLICFGFTAGIEQGDFLAGMFKRLQTYCENPEAVSIIFDRLATEAEIDAEKHSDFLKRTRKIFSRTPIHYCHHHQAHQANAFVASPYDEALVLTCDGRGDFKSLTISMAGNGSITELYHAYSWESLGYFYGRITGLCGFTPNRHEGKIVGLAAHGNPEPASGLMRKMIVLETEGIRTFPGEMYRPFFSNYSDKLITEAGRYSREDLAAAAQAHLESIICELVRKYAWKTGLRNVCLAGGVFANVKLNQRIRDLPEVDDVFISPNMGDGGICTGAVYHRMLSTALFRHEPGVSLYLGPGIDNQTLLDKLSAGGAVVEQPADLIERVVELLDSGQVVGLVQGRTEFGPRALGNRTIIARPDRHDLCDAINRRLDRSEFMPFAPAIAANLASRCLVGYNGQLSARHMTITYDVTEEFKGNSPAIIHVDDSVRPQVVHEEDNPFFFRLLNAFHEKTGMLCLINTSFNLHEEPIVASEDHIVSSFLRHAVDYLLFPPYLTAAVNPSEMTNP